MEAEAARVIAAQDSLVLVLRERSEAARTEASACSRALSLSEGRVRALGAEARGDWRSRQAARSAERRARRWRTVALVARRGGARCPSAVAERASGLLEGLLVPVGREDRDGWEVEITQDIEVSIMRDEGVGTGGEVGVDELVVVVGVGRDEAPAEAGLDALNVRERE